MVKSREFERGHQMAIIIVQTAHDSDQILEHPASLPLDVDAVYQKLGAELPQRSDGLGRD